MSISPINQPRTTALQHAAHMPLQQVSAISVGKYPLLLPSPSVKVDSVPPLSQVVAPFVRFAILDVSSDVPNSLLGIRFRFARW